MSEENVEIVRRLYRAMNDRDLEAVAECAHPDVEWIPDSRWERDLSEVGRTCFGSSSTGLRCSMSIALKPLGGRDEAGGGEGSQMDKPIPMARPRPGNVLARSLFFAVTGRISPAKGIDAVFAALADPTRRRVLEKLSRGGTVTASGLAGKLPISRQAVSKHLAALQDAELVEPNRVGRETRYSLRAESFDGAAMWIQAVSAEWDDRLEALRRSLRKRVRSGEEDHAAGYELPPDED